MNVIAYIRVSGKSQIDGDGYDRQKEKIDAFCKAHGLTVCGEYYEAAVSGTMEAMVRPQFAKAMQDLEEANAIPAGLHVGGIVVERMDRLARDLMVSEFLLTECRKRGLKVFCSDQGQLIDMASNDVDPTRILIRQIMAALAQWEKAMLVAKLGVARARKRQENGRCEGVQPYGTQPGEDNILRLIINLHDGGVGYSGIVDMLNTSNLKSRSGKPWTRGMVHHIYHKYRKDYERQPESEHDGDGGRAEEGSAGAGVGAGPESLDELMQTLQGINKFTRIV